MRAPKFNFIPERQLSQKQTGGGVTTSVSISKHNVLIFGSDYARIYDLEGKHVRIFADTEKKVVGWSFVEGKTDLDTLNDARLLKMSVNGNICLSIGKLMKNLDIAFDKSTRFDVKKYMSPLYKDDIYYISLKADEELSK